MKILAALVALVLCGCVGNESLTASELRRIRESGYDVYSCIMTRGIMAQRIFGSHSATIWLIVPINTPVKVTFNDCDILKLE